MLTPPQTRYSVVAGTTVAFTVAGTNPNGQPVTVQGLNVNGAPLSQYPDLVVVPATAPGTSTGRVTWPIACSTVPGTYRVKLRAATPGVACDPDAGADTVVTVTVLPNATQFDAAAPNVITPTDDRLNDRLNDRFAPRLSRSGSPTDCFAGGFRQLRIFNR